MRSLRRLEAGAATLAALCLYGYLAGDYAPLPWLVALPIVFGSLVGLGLEALRRRI